MKSLLFGIAIILIVGIGGFLYRNVVEYANAPLACPADARLCPDGTALGRTGPACTFPACPPPNVTVASLNVHFALPAGYQAIELPGEKSVAAYRKPSDTPAIASSDIIIRSFPLTGSSTPVDVIRATAIQDGSGLPAPATAFSSVSIGTRRFTTVRIGRFEGDIATAYYLPRSNDVLRFDAVDRGVIDWMEQELDVAALPAHTDVRALLQTLQTN